MSIASDKSFIYEPAAIISFTGSYRWLSNYHCAPVIHDGMLFSSTEHAYQAAKCVNNKGRAKFLLITCAAAQKLGQTVACRADWPDIKKEVMLTVVRDKFTWHPDLAAKLLATNERELVEGNFHHDNFYGSCFCQLEVCQRTPGRNVLGHILMQVRDELQG